MIRVLDGPFGIADVTIENALCGMDNGVIGRNLQRMIQQRIKGLSVVWYFAKKVLYLRPTIILLNV